jgi:hypothetical protein
LKTRPKDSWKTQSGRRKADSYQAMSPKLSNSADIVGIAVPMIVRSLMVLLDVGGVVLSMTY